MANTITLNELKPGDIMLFSIPEDSLLSVLIGKLTNSCVSHTGMSDYNPGFVLEEAGKNARRYPLSELGRDLYIRRLINADGESPDTSKVADIAMKYIGEELPYPISNLVFLGLYILIGDFIPDTLAGDVIKNILKLATYELIKLFNKRQLPDSDVPPMVCSQFAAACYDEAALTYGPEYKIHYNDKVKTVSSLIKRIIDQLTEDEGKKYKLEPATLRGSEDMDRAIGAEAGSDNYSAQLDSYCAQLIAHIDSRRAKAAGDKVGLKAAALGGNSTGVSAAGAGLASGVGAAGVGAAETGSHWVDNSKVRIGDDVIVAFYQYGKAFLDLFDSKSVASTSDASNGVNVNLLTSVSAADIKEVLEKLLRFQETFVTPEDLLSNTTNLKDMGVLTYTEEELNNYINQDKQA